MTTTTTTTAMTTTTATTTTTTSTMTRPQVRRNVYDGFFISSWKESSFKMSRCQTKVLKVEKSVEIKKVKAPGGAEIFSNEQISLVL